MSIPLDFIKSFKLIRATPTTFNKGRAVKGSTTETDQTGSIQSAREEELLQLPEGQRDRGAIVIYTEPELPLLTLNEATNTPADQVEVSGQLYEVQIVETWTYFSIGHNRSVATRVERKSTER